jgi:phage tail sheath protein FI
MPEYLSPGVYVEEIEIGAKPIEGVSTSTAGFVGMTERGPLNNPTLVTSFAEYQRTFGGYLGDDFKEFRFLPYAVEGFFSNGGQRAYITRVALKSKPETDQSQSKIAAKASGFLPNMSGAPLTLSAKANAGDMMLKIPGGDVSKLTIKDTLKLKGGLYPEFLTFNGQGEVLTLDSKITSPISKGDIAEKMVVDTTKFYTIATATANSDEITLNEDITSLNLGDVIEIGTTPSEICVITDKTPSKDVIKVKTPLKNTYNQSDPVKKLKKSQDIAIISSVKTGDGILVAYDAQNALNDLIKIGSDYFTVKITDSDGVVLISQELKYDHDAQSELLQLLPAINVTALNEGKWGNRIKIIVKESKISSSKLTANAPADQKYIDLETVVGMEKGTLLKLLPNGPYVSVFDVINSENKKGVILTDNLTANLVAGDEVQPEEFDLIVRYDEYEEDYRYLSLVEGHSRYLTKIITPTTSSFITVSVPAGSNPQSPNQQIPMPTSDDDPGWMLSGGEDGIPSTSEANVIYVGYDAPEPTLKTGLFALKNIDGISIVAIPGLSSKEYKNIQSKLINHCEIMGDRFAVLDSEKKADTTAIQAQRNLFDSKYAAIYYPWISIFDPLSQQQIDMPPSGHVCGIYARSDTERGVHKAPANEVVSGALDLETMSSGLRAIITKGQQDVLNPKGINCIRAFPGRGIRVWGARTISSDPLWHYVNVRRLFIYVEKSINDGTQWVVFEPNDEKLWARVKQTINQFLTTVWRSGALMGTTQDEAFFVKCDRSTMTQDDIDTGKLIVLIGIAPVKPAEFVIFRIAQVAKGSSIAG